MSWIALGYDIYNNRNIDWYLFPSAEFASWCFFASLTICITWDKTIPESHYLFLFHYSKPDNQDPVSVEETRFIND